MADAIEDFLNNVSSQLDSKQVKVGFIDGATHTETGESIAQIAVWNEYGDPANNQPPRPFFRNAIKGHEKEWSKTLSRSIRAGYPVDQVLEMVGAQIRGDVQESISQLMDPALSDATLHIRRTRKKRPTDSTKPLVDSGDMFGDVKYEVGEIEPSQDSQ